MSTQPLQRSSNRRNPYKTTSYGRSRKIRASPGSVEAMPHNVDPPRSIAAYTRRTAWPSEAMKAVNGLRTIDFRSQPTDGGFSQVKHGRGPRVCRLLSYPKPSESRPAEWKLRAGPWLFVSLSPSLYLCLQEAPVRRLLAVEVPLPQLRGTPRGLFPFATRSPGLPTMASELIYRGGHDAHPPESGSGYTPKPEKRLLWLWRPLRYLLQEQRLVFVLVGMALASLLFALAPSYSYTNSSSYSSAVASELALRSAMDRQQQQQQQQHHRVAFEAATRGFVGGKVPLGIKRKGLRIVVTGGAGFVGSHLVDRLIARGDSVIVVDNFFTGRKENVMHHFGNPNFELIRHDVVEPLLLEVDQIYHLACPASPVHYKFNPVKTIISFFLSRYSLLLHPFSAKNRSFSKLAEVSCFSIFLLPVKSLDSLSFCCGVHKTNVVGTLNMLGLAKRVGARFLLTSTSEVYGDPLQHPQVETYWGNVNPIGMHHHISHFFSFSSHRISTVGMGSGVRSCYDEGKRTAETLTMDYHRGAQVEVIQLLTNP
ncbi:hypothetical protein BHE74_00028686 [Ensete ventricosum]|nr:hypothetical protein BHE74_00028686 [Ensete ventricosum]